MTAQTTFTLPSSNTFEENVKLWVEHYNSITAPGEGFFFDFSNTPEYEKPILAYLTKNLGWKPEYNNTFIRKPL